MDTQENIHDWFAAQIPTHLTGGLHDEEQTRFTAHAAECVACADLLSTAQHQDAALQKMFENATPSEGFEDRIIQHLRVSGEKERFYLRPRMRLDVHPIVRRAAWAAAAAVMLAGLGYEAPKLIEGGSSRLVEISSPGQLAASNLRQIGVATFMYSDDQKGGDVAMAHLIGRRPDTYGGGTNTALNQTNFTDIQRPLFSYTNPTPNEFASGAGFKMVQGMEPTLALSADINPGTAGDDRMHRADVAMPQVVNDAVLLPTDDDGGDDGPSQPQNNPAKDGQNALVMNGGTAFDLTVPAAANAEPSSGKVSVTNALSLRVAPTGIRDLPAQGQAPGLLNGNYTYKDSTVAPQVAQPDFFKVDALAFNRESDQKVLIGGGGTLAQNGNNNFVGATTISGGALQLGIDSSKTDDADKATQVRLETRAIGLKYNQALEDARTHIANKDYSSARDDLANAQAARDENPAIINPDDLRRLDATIASSQRDLNNAIHADQVQTSSAQQATIAAAERQPIQKEFEQRRVAVNSLVDLARNDIAKNDYQDAKGVLDQINQLDPQNAFAASVQESVQNKVAALASPAPAQTPSPAPTPAVIEASRKIIRHGELSFEVDSFDSAFAQITKIADEEGGFIATANSDKLADGKVSGVVEVRVPPDHLDTFVLKLRALGDLKGQKIASDDVTKDYTDLESELRAATAMEDRLLDIIKTGKGEVKDLVDAERELGTWREKAEKITGEINYYNNLISYSTLQINLMERDIRQAALATEQEKVNIGLETEDVEKGRADALKAIDDAKGRIIQSDLKKYDAGQMAATIVAEVSPENAGPVTDRLKQLGRVARLDITRQQTVPDGSTVPPGVKVDQKDTELQISLYNLANIAPRESTNLSMACDDVESAYHAILTRITDAGGRVVDSSLNRVKPEQIDGSINCESPDDKADAVLMDIRAIGQVMHLSVAENPDAANVTSAKRGFAITLVSATSVAPREVITMSLMPAGNVPDAYHAILTAAQVASADVKTAQLQEQNTQSASATIIIDVPRKQQSQIDDAIRQTTADTGRIVSRQSARSDDTEHTLDTKVQFSLTLTSSEAIAPRDTIGRVLAVSNVPDAYNAVLSAAQSANAKIVTAQVDQSRLPAVIAELDLVVPRQGLDAVEKAITDAKADVVSKAANRAADTSTSTDEKTSLRLRFVDRDQLPPRQTTTATVQVSDPENSMADIKASALSAGGKVIEENLSKDDRYIAHLVIDVPLTRNSDFIDLARSKGSVTSIQQTMDPSMSDASFSRARLDFTLAGESDLVSQDSGIWATLKTGLSTSIKGLMYSLELIIIGLCLAGPWALVAWLTWKTWKRTRRGKTAPTPQ